MGTTITRLWTAMPLLPRLREALLPEYEVEREIASGGMGTVFLAREVALDRQVAIKILRPELATARAVERFLREARTLARLAHPNIVPVHHVGEAGGFDFYVMEYMTGETLAGRLHRKPLDIDEIRQLGRDVLDALEIAHRNDIIHRDVKPQNIFISQGRFVLGDFGIASASAPALPDGGDQSIAGTPQYMPPEQRYGWGTGPRTDLYAVGMVLYEALTGRRWRWFLPDDRPDWSKIPRRSGVLRVLRRALAFEPGDRWPDARSFRHALWRTRVRKYVGRTVALTAAGVAAGVGIREILPSGPYPADLAVTEFQTGPGADSALASYLTGALELHLDRYANGDRRINLVTNVALPAVDDPLRRLATLHANAYTQALVTGRADSSFQVDLTLYRKDHDPQEIRQTGTLVVGVACNLGREILRQLELPSQSYRCQLEDIPVRANELFLAGERAFRRQAWDSAVRRYSAALEIDSSFTSARWRRINAQRWLRDPPFEDLLADLRDLSEHHGAELVEGDRHLLEAWLTPFGPARIAEYAEAVNDLPRDAYTWLVFGDDLFMRGPLAGIPPDSARAVLDSAVALDSLLGPALMDLTWEAVRSGDSAAALAWLTRLKEAANPEQAPIPPDYFDLTYTLRFGTREDIDAALGGFLGEQAGNGGPDSTFLRALRWGASFELAGAQAGIASKLLETKLPDTARLVLVEARGLGLIGTGQYLAALADFDSAAALVPLSEAAVQAAQWRVLPAALDLLRGIPDSVVQDGRLRLHELTADSAVANRARWSLAVDAYARQDLPAARDLVAAIRETGDTAANDLVTFVDALERAAAGDTLGALAITDALVPYDAPRALEHLEPFLRTAIYVLRGRWALAADHGTVPDAWIWYLNADLTGWPEGLAQAGEIDWAVGPIVRLMRARALLDTRRRRNAREACRGLEALAGIWREPDAVFQPLRHEADSLFSERCR